MGTQFWVLCVLVLSNGGEMRVVGLCERVGDALFLTPCLHVWMPVVHACSALGVGAILCTHRHKHYMVQAKQKGRRARPHCT